MNYELLIGDCRQRLADLPAGSVQTCITSPPYFGLRSYMPDAVRLREDINAEELESVLNELKELGIKPI